MSYKPRTIKVTDRIGYPSASDIAIVQSNAAARAVNGDLAAVLAAREQELSNALQCEKPDWTYISRLREVIKNLRGTVNAVQR